MKKTLFLLKMIFLSFNSYSETLLVKPGDGLVKQYSLSTTLTISVTGNGNWVCSQPYTAGIVNQDGRNFLANQFGTTSDGVFGLKYLPWPESDSVVSISGTTKTTRTGVGVSGTGYIAPNTTFTWSNGKPVAGSEYSECLNSYPWILTPMPSGNSRGNGSSTSSLTQRIYIGPNAIPGEYNPDATALAYYVRDSSRYVSPDPLPSISVSAPMVCSIKQPGLINFGTINLNDSENKLLAYKNDDLTVNCQSSSASVKSPITISLSFSAADVYADNKKLKMRINSDNNEAAYIRGRLAAPLDGACGAYVGSNDVLFDGSVNKTYSVGDGQTIIPLTWSLCKSGGDYFFGAASAQATVSINWD